MSLIRSTRRIAVLIHIAGIAGVQPAVDKGLFGQVGTFIACLSG